MIRRLALFLSLLAMTGAACAQSTLARWVEGEQYFAIPNPQPTNHPDKVVVTEVFSFGCPACNAFEPYIAKLRAELPTGAMLEFVPASWHPNEDWPVMQRVYFTAKALGVDAKSHDAMFKAIWTPGHALNTYDLSAARPAPKPQAQLPTIEDVAKFYAQYGVKPTDFVATANSFAVKMDMKRADKQIIMWGATSTPTLIIDNKWRIDIASAGGAQNMLDLAQYLINRELAAKHAN